MTDEERMAAIEALLVSSRGGPDRVARQSPYEGEKVARQIPYAGPKRDSEPPPRRGGRR